MRAVGAAVVFNYQYPGKYAFNVLAGALDAHPPTRDVPLDFPRSMDGLVAAARARLDAGLETLVAWSFYSPGFAEARRQLASFRERVSSPRLRCIAGGVHATAEPAQTLAAGFDLVCIGEGERPLLELVRRLAAGDEARTAPGFASLAGDGTLRANGRGEPIALDDFPPFAARHRRFGAIEITRGCIYACRFCQTPFMNRARFRHRSVENTCHWVRAMCDAGLRDVRFTTPTSLSYGSPDERPRLDAVGHLLASVRQVLGPSRRLYYGTFPSELRPEHVTHEALELLRRYVDNDNLIVGGQSGSEAVLASSHRGHDVPTIVRAARLCLEHGFVPNVDFIFGLPGETQDDADATLALMRTLADLGAKVHGHTFMPLPGTPFKDAPPGSLAPQTQRALEALASRGRLYGHWRRQEAIAHELAQAREPSLLRLG